MIYNWSKNQDQDITQKYKNGESIGSIAQGIDRTPEAVHYRLWWLGAIGNIEKKMYPSCKQEKVIIPVGSRKKEVSITRYIWLSICGPIPAGYAVYLKKDCTPQLGIVKGLYCKPKCPTSLPVAMREETRKLRELRALEVKTMLTEEQRTCRGMAGAIQLYIRNGTGSISFLKDRFYGLRLKPEKAKAQPAPAPDQSPKVKVSKTEGKPKKTKRYQPRKKWWEYERWEKQRLFEYDPGNPESREVQLMKWARQNFSNLKELPRKTAYKIRCV